MRSKMHYLKICLSTEWYDANIREGWHNTVQANGQRSGKEHQVQILQQRRVPWQTRMQIFTPGISNRQRCISMQPFLPLIL